MNVRQWIDFRRQALFAVLIALAPLGAAFGAVYEIHEHQHVDTRFAHNRPYYDLGYVVHTAPVGYVIRRGPDRFWYDHGEWYRRHARGWVVVGAPLGVFVPVLPPFHTTVWLSGVPHYYANDTYYIWDGARQGYEVVAPPAGIDSTGTTQAPLSDSLYIYPRNGQGPEQQDRDRYECYRSAVGQTGYDPTRPGGGVPSYIAGSRRSDYLRSDEACLDARGYSVK